MQTDPDFAEDFACRQVNDGDSSFVGDKAHRVNAPRVHVRPDGHAVGIRSAPAPIAHIRLAPASTTA